MTREEFKAIYDAVPRENAYTEAAGTGYFSLPAFTALGVKNAFSTRLGGVSTVPFQGLNLSFTKDDREKVKTNFRQFSRAVGVPYESLVMDAYEHGTTVRYVTEEDCGHGSEKEPLPLCDGLVTDKKGVTLVTGHADCMAFYFCDPVKGIIGLCHAGWRGALNRIGCEVVRVMREHGSDPKDIYAGLGPSICPDCFEVGEDVAELFETAFPGCPLRGVNYRGHPKVDLWQVALCQFLESGILPEHVSFMGLCTMENEKFYSYRREGRTGGMAACLALD